MLATYCTLRGKAFTFFIVFLIILTSVLYKGGTQAHGQGTDSAPINHAIRADRLVLAFYYAWYQQNDWCTCHMSTLPTIRYNSTDDATIERQINWAAHAGITGFINSWWGPGDKTDLNFAKLLTHAASLQKRTRYPFASTLYIEGDAPALHSQTRMVNGLRYIASHYSNNPYFLRWHNKPVLFFWNPLGNGRTLALWAAIRQQVDPHHRWLWSAEGVDTNLLTVFDGIHLFSAGYWGLQHGNMAGVDKGFRNKVNTYNAIHHSHKIWAAGVMPGYDDRRVPGRVGTYSIPRNNGATYLTSWNAAIASNPEWITITTFNEWFEGAMIEPGITYGTKYLTITQQESKRWHG